MELLSRPLQMTLAQNREAVEAFEKRRIVEGTPYGNRHERRLAARVARRERVKEKEAT